MAESQELLILSVHPSVFKLQAHSSKCKLLHAFISMSELIKAYPSVSRLIRDFPSLFGLFKLSQSYRSLSELIRTYPSTFKVVQVQASLSKLIQVYPSLSKPIQADESSREHTGQSSLSRLGCTRGGRRIQAEVVTSRLQEYLAHNKNPPGGPYSSPMPRDIW